MACAVPEHYAWSCAIRYWAIRCTYQGPSGSWSRREADPLPRLNGQRARLSPAKTLSHSGRSGSPRSEVGRSRQHVVGPDRDGASRHATRAGHPGAVPEGIRRQARLPAWDPGEVPRHDRAPLGQAADRMGVPSNPGGWSVHHDRRRTGESLRACRERHGMMAQRLGVGGTGRPCGQVDARRQVHRQAQDAEQAPDAQADGASPGSVTADGRVPARAASLVRQRAARPLRPLRPAAQLALAERGPAGSPALPHAAEPEQPAHGPGPVRALTACLPLPQPWVTHPWTAQAAQCG